MAPDTFDSLRQAGFDFPRHQEFGIHPNDFAELLITSGLVLNPDTIWVAYNRCARESIFAPDTIPLFAHAHLSPCSFMPRALFDNPAATHSDISSKS